MLIRLLRRALRVLLRANTGPADGFVYALLICWLSFLVLTPDAAYAHAGLGSILAYKEVWVWPALLAAVATPIGWVSGRAWVHHGARIYQVMWWLYLSTATLIVAPTIIILWAPAICCTLKAFWIMVREWMNDVSPSARE